MRRQHERCGAWAQCHQGVPWARVGDRRSDAPRQVVGQLRKSRGRERVGSKEATDQCGGIRCQNDPITIRAHLKIITCFKVFIYQILLLRGSCSRPFIYISGYLDFFLLFVEFSPWQHSRATSVKLPQHGYLDSFQNYIGKPGFIGKLFRHPCLFAWAY